MNHYNYNPFIPTTDTDFDQKIYDQIKNEPLDNMFYLDRDALMNGATTIEFNSARYDMRPDLVSWDHFDSLALTNVIIMMNNCLTLFNFTRDNIGTTILIPDRIQVEKMLNSQI